MYEVYTHLSIPKAWNEFQQVKDNARLVSDFPKNSKLKPPGVLEDSRCEVLFEGLTRAAIALRDKNNFSWEYAVHQACTSAIEIHENDVATTNMIEKIRTWYTAKNPAVTLSIYTEYGK